MKQNDFSHDLLAIVEDTFNLLKTELTTSRNEIVQLKIDNEKMKLGLEAVKEKVEKKSHHSTAVVVAIITALGSLAVAFLKH